MLLKGILAATGTATALVLAPCLLGRAVSTIPLAAREPNDQIVSVQTRLERTRYCARKVPGSPPPPLQSIRLSFRVTVTNKAPVPVIVPRTAFVLSKARILNGEPAPFEMDFEHVASLPEAYLVDPSKGASTPPESLFVMLQPGSSWTSPQTANLELTLDGAGVPNGRVDLVLGFRSMKFTHELAQRLAQRWERVGRLWYELTYADQLSIDIAPARDRHLDDNCPRSGGE